MLPPAVSFWVALAACALAAASAVYNAWGRYNGGLLVAPAIALLFVMNIFPLLWSLGLSFFSYRANRARPPAFVGLDNYADVLTDPVVWERLQTTAILVVLTVTVQMVVGFLLAILFAKQFPLRRYLLILVLTPMMLSFVAVGAFFRYYYEPTFGLLSQFVRLFTGEPYILLQSTEGAMAGIVFADAWMWSPFVMLLVLAGLVSVPKYLYEAAEIDRASFWRKFTSITFPYIRGLLHARAALPHHRGLQALRRRVPADRGRPGHLDRDDLALPLPPGDPVQQDQRLDRDLLHPALHGDRADQPLSLFRQPAGAGRRSDGRRRSSRACRRGGGPTIARGVGEAGWGRTLGAAIVSLIYFFPVLWIILTAFKSYGDALVGAAEVPLHADARQFRPGVQPRLFGRTARRSTPSSTCSSSTRSSSPGPASSWRSSSARSPPSASRAIR